MDSVSNRLGTSCLDMLFISVLIIPILQAATVPSAKPLCEQQEACAIHIGLPLPLPCSCGPEQKCLKERLTQQKNIKHYQFCQTPTQIPICEAGQTAMVLDGYRHKFNCVCPNPFDMVSVSWNPLPDRTIYACSTLATCQPSDVCQRKVKIVKPQRRSNLRSLCRCQGVSRCKNATTYQSNGSEITDWTCV